MTAKILYNLNELQRLNNIYMDENTPDDQEDELIEIMNSIVANTVKLIVNFTKDNIDAGTAEKLVRFYPEKLIAILKKAR